jgi:hypothetical protein
VSKSHTATGTEKSIMIQKDLTSSTIFLTTEIIGFDTNFKSFAYVSTGHKDKGKKCVKNIEATKGEWEGTYLAADMLESLD